MSELLSSKYQISHTIFLHILPQGIAMNSRLIAATEMVVFFTVFKFTLMPQKNITGINVITIKE